MKNAALALILAVLAGCAAQPESGDDVLARYNGYELTRERVEAEMAAADMYTGDGHSARLTERGAIDAIILNIILTEEAEAEGLAATEEEIEEMIDMTLDAYELPSGREMMDAYFEQEGIDLDGYVERLRAQLPGVIARQKLRDSYGREYCEENGLEFTKVNPPEEMVEAVNARINRLFSYHADEIEYTMR